MTTKRHPFSRRKFLETSAVFVAGTSLTGPSLFAASGSNKHPNSMIRGVQIGVITYSFRSLPDQSAEATLQYVIDSGINAIELMGDPAETFAGKPANPVDRRAYYGLRRSRQNGETLTEDQLKQMADMEATLSAYNKEVASWRTGVSLDKFEALRKKYNKAGVSIYAFKPDAFGKQNTDAEIEWGLRAARALGASHVTLEHPEDDAHTLKLGTMAKKHKMAIGYHGHEQQTPTLWDLALKQSQSNGLNLDLGHYVAAGNEDILGIVKAKNERILSMHLKDRQSPANGKGNVLWGTGDTPIMGVLQLMRDNKYKFPGTIELEYDIPEGSDPVSEVKKCLEFCREALT